MLDIKFLRNNPDIVKQNIKNKFQDEKLPLVDEVIELDKRNREIKQEVEGLRADKNKASKQIGAMMGQKKFEEAEALKQKVGRICWQDRFSLRGRKRSRGKDQKDHDDNTEYHRSFRSDRKRRQ